MMIWYNILRSLMSNYRLLWVVLTGVVIMWPLAKGACYWEHCTQEFDENAEDTGLEEDSTFELCQALESHEQCLRGLAKSCRGNFGYQAYLTGVTRLSERKNCSQILADPPELTSRFSSSFLSTTTEPFVVMPAYHGCSTIQLESDVSFCSIFGDPHVITNDSQFQTCSLIGAYPFIENRHLAVQVSSKPVRRSSYSGTVTSVSRVTVIVKSSECSEERKTYEASLGHFPTLFTDYTSESDSVKIIERIPNQLIEVRILHLKTIIFIRQIGDYLSVAVRLPKSLLDIETAARYQLCSAGCPAREVLSRSDTVKELPIRAVQQAEQWCQRHNLTGPFYAACLFDFSLTGDLDAVLMAKEAQLDWERLAPIDSHTPAWTFRSVSPTFGVSNAAYALDIGWRCSSLQMLVVILFYLFSLSCCKTCMLDR